MITHIEGKLVEKNLTDVVIDCNGVGYLLNISLHTYSQIPDKEKLKLYTHFIVREDSHTLYGFSSVAEREIFKLLISVNGVKGIGAKTAQRVILDLKDKILKVYDIDEVSVKQNNTVKEEALSALEVLGFIRKQSERIIDKIITNNPNANVETIIKEALKNL